MACHLSPMAPLLCEEVAVKCDCPHEMLHSCHDVRILGSAHFGLVMLLLSLCKGWGWLVNTLGGLGWVIEYHSHSTMTLSNCNLSVNCNFRAKKSTFCNLLKNEIQPHHRVRLAERSSKPPLNFSLVIREARNFSFKFRNRFSGTTGWSFTPPGAGVWGDCYHATILSWLNLVK